MKISDCCGASPWSNGDCDTEDYGICPDCLEHCEYIEYCDDCGEEIDECACNENEETLDTVMAATFFNYNGCIIEKTREGFKALDKIYENTTAAKEAIDNAFISFSNK